jgi:hypothetical protein
MTGASEFIVVVASAQGWLRDVAVELAGQAVAIAFVEHVREAA